jgi:hypothetical protein
MGEWLNSLGKFVSFRKLIDTFAIELEVDEGFELLNKFLELALTEEDSVSLLSNVCLSLDKLIVLLRLFLLIDFNDHL